MFLPATSTFSQTSLVLYFPVFVSLLGPFSRLAPSPSFHFLTFLVFHNSLRLRFLALLPFIFLLPPTFIASFIFSLSSSSVSPPLHTPSSSSPAIRSFLRQGRDVAQHGVFNSCHNPWPCARILWGRRRGKIISLSQTSRSFSKCLDPQSAAAGVVLSVVLRWPSSLPPPPTAPSSLSLSSS